MLCLAFVTNWKTECVFEIILHSPIENVLDCATLCSERHPPITPGLLLSQFVPTGHCTRALKYVSLSRQGTIFPPSSICSLLQLTYFLSFLRMSRQSGISLYFGLFSSDGAARGLFLCNGTPVWDQVRLRFNFLSVPMLNNFMFLVNVDIF